MGQALRARALGSIDEITADVLDFDDVYHKLDLDTLEPGSLASQVLDAIETGNADELRKVAVAKRVQGTNDIPVNESNVMTQVRILNNVRKDNLFLSPNTWIQRNVVAGAMVNFSNGMEDFYSAAFRTGSMKEAWAMSQFAGARMYMGMSSAFGNALQMLQTGKATFTKAGIKEGLDPLSLANRKQNTKEAMQQAAQALNDAWTNVFENPVETAAITPPAVMNLLNYGARYVLGQAIESLPYNSTAGYMPAFSLLSAGDEVTRKMAFDWKASSTAYLNALDEWDKLDNKPRGVSKAEWVGQRATERSDAAVFNGLMTDDELASLRRRAGAMQYSDMGNEALRLKVFNDQNGLPNPGTPEGLAGMQRAAEATFTNKITDPIGQGIQQMRQNPLVGWVMPVFQTPYNGMKWMLDRDIFIALPRQLMQEYRQARANIKGDRHAVHPLRRWRTPGARR